MRLRAIATTVPMTVEDLMAESVLASGLHRLAIKDCSITLPADDLRPILVAAYDPENPDWTARIQFDDSSGFWIT